MGSVVFAADDGVTGRELWVSDGTDTWLAADINPGEAGSDPDSLTLVNGRVVFVATSADGGRELWSVDYQNAPVRLMDIYPGATSSNPIILKTVGNQLFFTANNATIGRELYVTDGTVAGTHLVKEIRPGTAAASGITYVGFAGDRVVFLANDGTSGREMWASDGTEAGTVLLSDSNPGAGGPTLTTIPGSNPSVIGVPSFNVGAQLYYTIGGPVTGFELWVTDGTAAGTRMLRDIEPGSASSWPGMIADIGGKLLFSASDSATGRELWVTDGTTAGTIKLTALPDFYTGLTDVRMVGGNLYFTANDGGSYQLWRTDGTTAGTYRISPTGVSLFFLDVVELDGALLFRGQTQDEGAELWISHGQPGDAQLLKALQPGRFDGYPRNFHKVGDTVLFVAETSTNRTGLWKTDGTAAGTVLVKEIYQYSNLNVEIIGDTGGRVLFRAAVTGSFHELWSTDGGAAGTVRLATYVQDFPQLQLPSDFMKLGDRYVYIAGSEATGRELWTTDGTTAGTRVLFDSLPGGRDGVYSNFRIVDGKLYFTAETDSTGVELWQTDGTVAGTHLVTDANPAVDPSVGTAVGYGYTEINGGAIFEVESITGAIDHWFTDGTVAGTVRLLAGDAAGYGGWVVDGKYFFPADIPGHGMELWVTDGTVAGTHMSREIGTGAASGLSSAATIKPFGDGVMFTPRTGTAALWISDGTSAGTIKLLDVPGTIGVLRLFDGRAFVEVTNGGASQLWTTDGTIAGTINLGPSAPSGGGLQNFDDIVQIGDQWLFVGLDAGGQAELAITDGTVAGTHLLADINASGASFPNGFAVVGDKVFFTAGDGSGGGGGLWVTDGTAAGTTKLADAYRDLATTRILGVDQAFTGFGFLSYGQTQTLNGKILFVQEVGGMFGSQQLFASDGTVAGTVALGFSGAFDGAYAFRDGHFIFSSRTSSGSTYDLWSTDGTAAGTVRLVQDTLYSISQLLTNPVELNGDMVYVTRLQAGGMALWTTDGTVAGSRQIATVGSSISSQMASLGNRLIFAAANEPDNTELWVTDGNGATRIEIMAGATGSWPHDLTLFQGQVYFIVDTGEFYELWKTDGTAAGTVRATDLNLGDYNQDPELEIIAGRLAFMASDGVNGFELYAYDGVTFVRLTDAVGASDGNPGPVIELPTPPPPPTLNGSARTETLNGAGVGEILNGLGGNDTLNGNGGDDTLNGGDGADQLFGGAGIDTLVGGAGNDRLDGGDGADILRGGVGNDVYVVGAGDVIEELAGEGLDSVTASVSFTLSANVENLTLTTIRPIDGFGNDLANKITGTNYANRLEGGGGVDTLDGLNGNDIILGGSGGDIIQGGGGNDVITGGTGNDTIRGGNGADVFVVLQESVGVNEIDTLNDFYLSQGDIIDLSAIDANALVDGDQAFSLVSAFSKAAGQMTLTWVASQARTLLKLDVNGDGKVDYQMKINGNVTGASDDWAL